MMETRTRGKGTIDRGLRGSMGTLDDMNPTRLSKQSQAVLLQVGHRVYVFSICFLNKYCRI